MEEKLFQRLELPKKKKMLANLPWASFWCRLKDLARSLDEIVL